MTRLMDLVNNSNEQKLREVLHMLRSSYEYYEAYLKIVSEPPFSTHLFLDREEVQQIRKAIHRKEPVGILQETP